MQDSILSLVSPDPAPGHPRGEALGSSPVPDSPQMRQQEQLDQTQARFWGACPPGLAALWSCSRPHRACRMGTGRGGCPGTPHSTPRGTVQDPTAPHAGARGTCGPVKKAALSAGEALGLKQGVMGSVPVGMGLF